MATKVLKAKSRVRTGSSESRRLRRQGLIPGIVYGGKAVENVSIESHQFETEFKHIPENEIIRLDIDGKAVDVLIKDFQSDILKKTILHIDFIKIEKGKAIRTHVPVKLVGSSKGVREGGILENPLHELEIECLPKDLPESIEINIADLEAGHALHIGNITAPAGVRILNSSDQVVAFVGHMKTASISDEHAEAAADENAEEEKE